MGDTWTTESVSVTGGVDVLGEDGAATAPTASAAAGLALAARIEAALEALPNNVVPDVQVTYMHPTSTAERSGATVGAGEMDTKVDHYTISFFENTGNLPTMGVAYSVVDNLSGSDCMGSMVSTNAQCEGMVPDFRMPSDCYCTLDTQKLTVMKCA